MMQKTLSLLALSCSTFLFSQQTNENVTINSENREYIQYLPSGFDAQTESLPVVFILHGLGGTAANMTGVGMNYIADTARTIVLYPQGLNNSYDQASWNSGVQYVASSADDVGLFNHLIDKAITEYNADPEQIYFAGFSMGAIMSHHMACAMNDRIAAIGTLSGTMPTVDIDNCTPNYKTPVIHFHGTTDETVPYDSNPVPSLSLVPETMEFWRTVHGCATTTDSIRQPDTAADGYTVDQFVYQTCDRPSAVELWRMNDAGHVYLYEPLNDITEIVETWLFFRRYKHTNVSGVSIDEYTRSEVSVYPNPASTEVYIDGINSSTIELYSTTGKKVGVFALSNGKSINIENVSPGMYYLKATELEQPISLIIE